MNCDYCNTPLRDDDLVCGNCGDRVAERTQTKKIDNLKKNLVSVFSTNFKSPLALVLAVAMSVIALSNFVSALSDIENFIGLAIGLLIGIVALIDAIGLWKLWSSSGDLTPKSVNALKGYVSLSKTLNTIAMVLLDIVGGLLIVLAVALLVAIGNFGEELEDALYEFGDVIGDEIVAGLEMAKDIISMGPTILLVVAIVLTAAVTAYFVLFNRALKRVIKYTNTLSTSIEYSAYKNQDEPPYTSLFVFGVFSILGGFIGGGVWAILSGVAFGAYLIVTALFFKNIHEEAQKHNASIDAETAILEDITRRTNLYIIQNAAAKKAAQQADPAAAAAPVVE